MPARARYTIRRGDGSDAVDVAELYALPHHGEVCLHSRDRELVHRLEAAGLIASPRPPFLDAADRGVHGGYRPTAQVNLFFAPPIEDVAAAIGEALAGDGGYRVEDTAPAPT